ncbi:AAA family ATPase [Nonomuraea rosea]
MLSSNAHILTRSFGEVLILPHGPVTSVSIRRLTDGMLGLAVQDWKMLFIHGDAQQRADIVSRLREHAAQGLRYCTMPSYASSGQVRTVLCAALGLHRPTRGHPHAVDRLIHHALAGTSRMVVLDQAQHLHATGSEYVHYLSERTDAMVIAVVHSTSGDPHADAGA